MRLDGMLANEVNVNILNENMSSDKKIKNLSNEL
jgi:hypothetical protein